MSNNVCIAPALDRLSDFCDRDGGGGAAKLEGISLVLVLVIDTSSSLCGLLDNGVAAELDKPPFASVFDALLSFKVHFDDFSSLSDLLDGLSEAAALEGPLSLCDLIAAVLGKSTL